MWSLPDPNEKEKKPSKYAVIISLGIAAMSVLVGLCVMGVVITDMYASLPDCGNVTNDTLNLSQLNATWCKYDNGTGGYVMNGTVWNHTDGYLT